MGLVSAWIVAVTVVLVTYYALVLLRSRNARLKIISEHECKAPPKYPHRDPIFGIDLFLDHFKNLKAHRALPAIKERFDRYGQTFQALSMGRVAIWTNDPENFQAVHASNFLDYGVQPLRRKGTLPFLGEGVFTMDGSFWEHSRAIIRPSFTRTNVANLPAFEVHFKKFLDLIPRDGSPVDLKPLLYRLFLDTSTEFLFGDSMEALSPDTPFQTQQFLDAFHYAQRGMGKRMQMGIFMFLHHDPKWYNSIKIAHTFADKYVDKALQFRSAWLRDQKKNGSQEDDKERYVLLQEIAKETDNPLELRSQILHVFLAGHDSTATTISNAIFHLCRHQDKWHKFRAEVLAIGDAPLTFELLKSMHYLQSVIKETLRLYPVAPTDSRYAYRDTILPTGGGPSRTSPILVQRGQLIISSFHALHRRSETWGPDPEAFRPERWNTTRPGWSYLPFGGGPRKCPGQRLALTEAAYVLARMAQEWSGCDCRDEVSEWVEEMKITASSRNGVKVALVPA